MTTPKFSRFTKSGLRQFLEALDLSVSGSKEDLVERILAFLLEPTDSGKVYHHHLVSVVRAHLPPSLPPFSLPPFSLPSPSLPSPSLPSPSLPSPSSQPAVQIKSK